ncbi:MAG: hypothetical protein R2822_30870 [Spirosomataceae bacterium]
MLIHGQVVEIAYNQQAAVDGKHNLVIATHTLKCNDKNTLSGISVEVLDNTQSDELTVTKGITWVKSYKQAKSWVLRPSCQSPQWRTPTQQVLN